MSEETPDSLIPYDSIVQEALRAVVGRVLSEIEDGGGELPGAHHFYITFKTHAPGVSIPASLRERFPDEMTIVLQYQFWGLKISEEAFEITLSFSGTNERLYIPFDAVVGFADPSVNFGLQFKAAKADVGEINPGEMQDIEDTGDGNEPPPSDIHDGVGDDNGERTTGEVVALDAFRKNKT